MSLPGMNSHVATVYQEDTNADSEGNYDAATLSLVGTVIGTLGQASATEQAQASQRGQTVDAVFAAPNLATFAVGNVVSVGTHSWVVVEVRANRLNQRIYLRQLS